MNKINWHQANIGDSALVVSENKMGVILREYNQSFYLRFVDGSGNTYDASELIFYSSDDDEFSKGGNIKVGSVYDFENVEYDPKKQNNYKSVKQVEVVDIDSKGQVIARVVGTTNNFIIREPKKYLKINTLEKMKKGGPVKGITQQEWKSILTKLLKQFYGEYEDSTPEDYENDDSITVDEAKPYYENFMDKYKTQKTMSQAYSDFYKSLTDEEKKLIEVKTASEEYADAEEHDRNKSYRTITIRKKENMSKMETGGVVGQEVVIDYQGDEKRGYIKEITEDGDYIVNTDDGRTVLAQKELDIISFGGTHKFAPEAKKRFSFFKDGGNVKVKQKREITRFGTLQYRTKVVGDYNYAEISTYGSYGMSNGYEVEFYKNDGTLIKDKTKYFPNNASTKYFQEYYDALEYAKKNVNSEKMKDGGSIEKENNQMLHSQSVEAKHHADELSRILTSKTKVEPWIVAKMERATTDLSDVTHYLEGEDKAEMKKPIYAHGGGVDRYSSINDFKGTKIRFKNKDEALKFQEFIFSLGGTWYNGSQVIDRDPRMFAFVDSTSDANNFTLHEGDYRKFKASENKRIYFDDIFGKNKTSNKMAKGGMTEHGLRRGDTIVYNQADDVMVIDKKNNQHLINLDKGERYNKGGKMAEGGKVGEVGVTYFIGRPSVDKVGRFNTRMATWVTCIVEENGYKRYSSQSIKFSAGSANNIKVNGIKITQKEFDKLDFSSNSKMSKGGGVERNYIALYDDYEKSMGYVIEKNYNSKIKYWNGQKWTEKYDAKTYKTKALAEKELKTIKNISGTMATGGKMTGWKHKMK